MLKTIALCGVIGGPVLAGFLYIIDWAGESFFFYVWAFMCGFTLFINTIFPTLIQPLFNTFKSLEEGELKNKINALAKKISFPLSKIFVIDGSKRSSHSNAYFYGLWNDKRIVIFDTLLEHSSHEEIIAVLGHELGHWKGSHQWKRLVTVRCSKLDPNSHADFILCFQ
jgi:STE24 endopeptidase